MSDASNAWLPLVVDEGQLARTDGTLIRLNDAHCVLADGGTVVMSGGSSIAASPLVRLRSDPSSVVLGAFEDRTVAVTGRLTGGEVHVGSVSGLSRTAQVDRVERPLGAPGSSPVRHVFRERSAVERTLLQEGVLLELWLDRESATTRYVAIATDAERASDALWNDYGPSLTVVQSKWTEATLRHIENEIISTGRAVSFGRRVGPDLQMQVTATLLHLSTLLANRLARYPVDAIDLQLLLVPMPN